MDVLSDVAMKDLPDEILKQLAEVMPAEDSDLMQKKVSALVLPEQYSYRINLPLTR
jgi:hypothetical protein